MGFTKKTWCGFVATPILMGLLGSCWAPTQVTVVLTTDLGCGAPIQTAIYKGQRGQFTAESTAETSQCTATIPDSQIGTLVFVPSGNREGEVSVKAILAQNGKLPVACDSDPADCIIATRSFSFVEHESRRVPIRLLKSCLGKKCGPGETCAPDGTCISDHVTCDGESCEIAPTSDAGTVSDAGVDAPGDRDGAVSPPCTIKGSDTIVSRVIVPTHAASTPKYIYWVAAASKVPGAEALHRADKGTGEVVEVQQVGGIAGDRITTLGTVGEKTLLGIAKTTTFEVKIDAASFLIGASPSAVGGDGTTYFASTASGIWKLQNLSFVPIANTEQVEAFVSVPAKTLIVGAAAAGLYRATGDTFSLVNPSPTAAVLAANSEAVYAVGKAADATTTLFKVTETESTAVLSRLEATSSIAADAARVYFAQGSKINALDLVGSAVKQPPNVLTENGAISHVMVDDACLYYWVTDNVGADGLGSLRIKPKGPSVSPVGP